MRRFKFTALAFAALLAGTYAMCTSPCEAAFWLTLLGTVGVPVGCACDIAR